ncbi:SRPBCC family protein [Singulisphaera sp. PoT]|uniref:SRPBCC family protein n=1 Tax=Singulisphaera sp. PoT TaxID=3411797 RepID=UPI003BF4D398
MNKKFKTATIVLVLLLSSPFLVALFLPRDFVVEREVTIDKPKPAVFAFVKSLKNQEKYSKWALMDPKMKTTYTGTDGTVGFIMAWESDNQDVGKGEQEIKKIAEGERVDVEIRIKDPFVSTNPASTITEALGESQTRVKSVYTGMIPYPMNLLCYYVRDSIGKDMATNLANLKALLEKP